MDIPKGISDIFSVLGVPAGAVMIAAALIRGAAILEKDANESALKDISSLLISGNISSFNKISAALVSSVFNRVFGRNPLSIKFILRSMFISTMTWLILLSIRHPDWSHVWKEEINQGVFIDFRILNWTVIGMWYVLDWISLSKAGIIMRLTLGRSKLSSFLLFFLVDVVLSFMLSLIFFIAAMSVALRLMRDNTSHFELSILYLLGSFPENFTEYFTIQKDLLTLETVIFPSTMLTSIWTLFIVLSGVITILIAPLDRLRRFTVWWFRDVETRPLTAIAKVAGVLIIAFACVAKVVQWI